MLKRISGALAASLCLTPLAYAQSTINTGQPATNADLTSLVVRQQFTAAASDINGLAGMHAATSLSQCPSGVSVVVGEDCLTVGSTPFSWFKWTGSTGGWALVATINPTTGVLSIGLNSGDITSTNPISLGFNAGVATLGLNFNPSLQVDTNNNLGINYNTPGTYTAPQMFPAGSITNTELANSTISGISLGQNLDALTFGTHLAAGGASYNGSAAVTISTDATSLNTASAIVARDSSGNFSAGTITASLTGHASLDLATGALGANVQAALGNPLNASGGLVGFSGALGTPTLLTLTNATGLPIGGISGLGTGVGAALGAGVSGSGDFALTTSPSLTTPSIAGGALSGTFTGPPTFSGNIIFSGDPLFTGISSGTCVHGLALDSGNNTILMACTGSASAIQVGATTITSPVGNGPLTDNSGVLGNVVWGQLPGITSATPASAGNVGELISSNILAGSAVSAPVSTTMNITSVSLTPGEWSCDGNVWVQPGTSISQFEGWISSASATQPTRPNGGGDAQFSLGNTATISNDVGISLSSKQFLLATTTTVFLSFNPGIAVGNTLGFGALNCHRTH
jgi:hypothetical protein